jgi:hypothetical protein
LINLSVSTIIEGTQIRVGTWVAVFPSAPLVLEQGTLLYKIAYPESMRRHAIGGHASLVMVRHAEIFGICKKKRQNYKEQNLDGSSYLQYPSKGKGT